ncbi:MAG TPA: trypsin-like peptidase domain-containing protein [Acidobacteriota bacterium]
MSKKGRRFFASASLVALGLLAGAMITQLGSAVAGPGQQVSPAVGNAAPALDEWIPQRVFVRVAETTQPALVYIQTEQTVSRAAMLGDVPEFFRRFFDEDEAAPELPDDQVQASQGSGFLISSSGYVVTNAHVVSQTDFNAAAVIGADSITVRLNNDDEYDAEIVGVDIGTDLAVIKIDAGYELPFLPLGNSDEAKVGEWVMALGAPFGLTNTVSAGIISAKGRAPFSGSTGSTYQDFIQTDAQINPGNSGGPMVNLRGEVIGINTAIVSNSFQAQFAGVGFAIPINLVSGVVDQLIEHGHTIRGWLGVSMGPLGPGLAEGYGLDPRELRGAVIIRNVNEGEPADLAGVQEDDIVVGTDGVRLQNDQDFLQRIAVTPPNETISLEIIRVEPDDSPTGFTVHDLTIEVTLGERPPEVEVLASNNSTLIPVPERDRGNRRRASELERRLGLTLAELTERNASELGYDLANGGVLVTWVSENGPAARAGLPAGSIIRDVNGRPVAGVEGFEALMSEFDAGEVAILGVRFPTGINARVPLRIPEAG